MGALLKRHANWLMPMLIVGAITVFNYWSTTSVKAAVSDSETTIKAKLESYVTKEELYFRESARNALRSETDKRIEGKIDDVIKRLERFENRPPPAFRK